MYPRVQGALGRTAVWSWTVIPVAITIALALLPVLPARAAVAAVTRHRIKTVTYLGHSFGVPRGWRVINLVHHPRTCVRFDRHAIYLGTPATNEACPSSIIGTTEAMLIEPAARGAAPQAAENPVTRQITVTGQRLHVVATFRRHPGQIRRILGRAAWAGPCTWTRPGPSGPRWTRRSRPGLPATTGSASTPAPRPAQPR